ncbi:cobyrinate a,c-diamide synthase [Marinagarivorans algicola]|uniref:cobyrinate a,c-diamide synthase n=1 Tax=Marinagarivorans algicola TaxID=1513270 RepID=UPI0006B3F964|nr:cobyrinate a,c-diamide synthase [Marinagarivorans algicola]
MTNIACPALFLTAPASGQGKTTVTAAFARLLKRQGKDVRIFKTGPDYLDPQILAQASGQPVVQIDLWMAGDPWCQHQFYLAAQQADLILVEGAMGMFDGEPSSADLATRFNIPLAIVMDVKGMAQTAAAIAVGLASFREDINVIGLIANNCGSERHRQLIEGALPPSLPMLANVARSEAIALPERHLGLVQAHEVRDELEKRFEAGADALDAAGFIDILRYITPVNFEAITVDQSTQGIPAQWLTGTTVALAKDEAFTFIYEANVALLETMGATIVYFSPLHDQHLPVADALWLPGGYPELHAKKLAENHAMIADVKAFYIANKPILAECGGFLYCLQTLSDLNGDSHVMAGLIAGQGVMRGKRGCQGMQVAPLPEGDIRGHAHHRSRSAQTPVPIAHGVRQRHPAPGEAIYRERQLTASYLHLFFPSNAKAIADLFLGQAG